MRASEGCISHLMVWEAFRPTAYKPTPHDVWTIGFGHTNGVEEGATCNIHQAIVWLHSDIRSAEEAVNDFVKVVLKQNEFDALVSLVFNIGIGAFEESTLLRKLNDNQDIGTEWGKWTHQNGKVLAGLVNRRTAEWSMFSGPAPDTTAA